LRTTAVSRREELADVLQTLMVSELMNPSKPLWIVSPWISDVELLDNRVDQFSGLVPDLSSRWVRLGEILTRAIAGGGSVVVATRPDDHNMKFVNSFESSVAAVDASERLTVRFATDLHEKGILTDRLHLSGSMNLTFNGLRRLEEAVQVNADPESVARVRHTYVDRWA
jgi:hypothetical protein